MQTDHDRVKNEKGREHDKREKELRALKQKELKKEMIIIND